MLQEIGALFGYQSVNVFPSSIRIRLTRHGGNPERSSDLANYTFMVQIVKISKQFIVLSVCLAGNEV